MITAQDRADKLRAEYLSLAKNDPRRNEVWGRLNEATHSALRVGNRERRKGKRRAA